MFSSSNPFPSSIHGLPPHDIFFGQEEYDVYFNDQPFVDGDHTPPLVIGSDDRNHQNLSRVEFSSPSKKRVASSKKDRHNKIITARGPRERRVRLSINISKKFFGLQDLLGFDKASKTLDWLFTKSKTAIKDLVEEMKHTSSSTLCDICEQVFLEKEDCLAKKEKDKEKKKKTTQKQKSKFHVNLVARNQKRAEARSRARARTIEKLRIKTISNDVKHVVESRCGIEIQSQCNHEVSMGELLTEQ